MKSRYMVASIAMGLSAWSVWAALPSGKPEAATKPVQFSSNYHPAINPANFSNKINNPWFPLVPGTHYRYRETLGTEVSDVDVTVLPQTKIVMGVPCVVVHDLVSKAGKTIEDTYDWYSQDATGNVWYFGEDTKEYDDKGHVDTAGSWEAGVKGAQPGIMMQANPTPGPAFRTEYFRGEAEDVAQIIEMTDSVTVPAGRYAPSLQTKEWSLLEPGSEKKWYGRGVGFIRSVSEKGEVSELVTMSTVK
jgi:hypothetical protein